MSWMDDVLRERDEAMERGRRWATVEMRHEREAMQAQIDRLTSERDEARERRDRAVILLRELFNRVGYKGPSWALYADIEAFLREVGER